MNRIPGCRSCGCDSLVPVLDMGATPLANRLLTREQLDEPEPRYPLELVFCPGCSLVQITETVPPETLFGEYLYFSSFSQTMLDHARAISQRLTAQEKLSGQSLVVEVASNDGYLLQYYREKGVPVLGIEPARNIAEVAREQRQIPTLCEFFGEPVARRLAGEGRRADVIHANNVLAHVADLNGVVAGFAAMVKPTGLVVVEAPYLRDMIEQVEFDTIYHEHLCYFSLSALDKLFLRHGLEIVDVEHLGIHGGSLRIHAAPQGSRKRSAAVHEMLDQEQATGMRDAGYYRDFGRRVEQVRHDLCNLLGDLKQQGHTVAVYGASAKGSTLLNYFGLGRDQLDFVADRSTVKQGRYTPGTHLPIVAPTALVERMPAYTLLLTWNFKDEIMAQQAEYRRRGGRFILPIPAPQVV